MRRNELDYFLGALLDFHKDVSDINFTVDKPMQVESRDLVPRAGQSPVERLSPFQTEMIALNLIGGSHRLTEGPARHGIL